MSWVWECEGCGNKISFPAKRTVFCSCGSRTEHAVQAIHYNEWPLWAKLIAKRKIDSDIGVGDTAQRIAARVGGEKFKRMAKFIGIPCGCAERQANWNLIYPYGIGQESNSMG